MSIRFSNSTITARSVAYSEKRVKTPLQEAVVGFEKHSSHLQLCTFGSFARREDYGEEECLAPEKVMVCDGPAVRQPSVLRPPHPLMPMLCIIFSTVATTCWSPKPPNMVLLFSRHLMALSFMPIRAYARPMLYRLFPSPRTSPMRRVIFSCFS